MIRLLWYYLVLVWSSVIHATGTIAAALLRVPFRPGGVYDSNAALLAAAIEEAGGAPNPLGIGRDDEAVLSRFIDQGLACADMVLVSGGTSKLGF